MAKPRRRVQWLSRYFGARILLGDQFRTMLQRPAWFVCERCGHTVIPGDSDFKCSCRNCQESIRAA